MIATREIGFEDLESAGKLMSSVGWGTPTRSDWERLWLANPARSPQDPPLPHGWVLEDEGRVVGMAMSLAQAYRLQRRRLRAAIFAGLVVEPKARGSTMKLLASYVRQDVDLLLSPASAPETVKLLGFAKLSPMPQPQYDVTCYWVTKPSAFLAAGLRKKGVPHALSVAAGFGGAPLLWLEGRLHGRGRGVRKNLELRVLAPGEIDGRFDELWERKLAEGPKLLAERTQETLRWHFSRPAADPPFIVAAYSGGTLEGYVAVVRQDSTEFGLARARVADVFVLRDDPATIRELLVAALVEARSRGAAMVELVGFPPPIRAVAEELRPFRLSSSAWPFHYKARDARLHRTLAAPELWHASLFDGDGSL
jgi:hypothetical protein